MNQANISLVHFYKRLTMTDVVWSSVLLRNPPNLELFCADTCFRVHREVLACHSSLLREMFLSCDECGPIFLEDVQLADVRLLLQVMYGIKRLETLECHSLLKCLGIDAKAIILSNFSKQASTRTDKKKKNWKLLKNKYDEVNTNRIEDLQEFEAYDMKDAVLFFDNSTTCSLDDRSTGSIFVDLPVHNASHYSHQHVEESDPVGLVPLLSANQHEHGGHDSVESHDQDESERHGGHASVYSPGAGQDSVYSPGGGHDSVYSPGGGHDSVYSPGAGHDSVYSPGG